MTGPGGGPSADARRQVPGEADRWVPPMRVALAQARAAAQAGDVPVGAAVVGPDGELLAAARNAREADGDPTAHAEIVAIRAASKAVRNWRLHGCTLLVTLEPCTMCAGAVVLARLDRLVFGAIDPKAGAVGSLYDIPADTRLNHRPAVVAGVLADECGSVLREFFRARRTGTTGDAADGARGS